MSPKTFVFLGMIIGSIIGGYIPILFGFSFFSYASVLGNGIGALMGIFIGLKISETINY